MMVRHVKLASPALTFVLLSTAAFAQAGLALAPGDPAPLMRGRSYDHHFIKTDYPSHRLTVINFWAPWCEPCKAEMPALQKLHEAYGVDDLAIIGVLHDNASEEMMSEFAKGLGITYPLITPHGSITGKWAGLGVLPTTFLVDQKGAVLRKYVGATPEQIVGLVHDIEAAMAGKPLGPVIIPEKPAVSTEEEREKQRQKQVAR